MTHEEVFAVQANLMRQAALLLETRMKKIEPEEKSADLPPADAMVRMFHVRSLRLYKDTLNYLAMEVEKNVPSSNYYFLLPHARTLLDVYARFLHLRANCPDVNRRASTCVAYWLYTFKALNKGSEYENILNLHRTFLEEQGLPFPNDPTELKYKRDIENRGLAFANKNELLTQELMREHSVYAKEFFKAAEVGSMYAAFSEFLHGNPFYYQGEAHNERYWVVTTSLMVTAFLMELVDRYVLERDNPRDAREWRAEVVRNKTDLLSLWPKRKSITAESA